MAQNVRSVISLLVVGVMAWVVAGVAALAAGAASKVLWTCFFGAILGMIGIRSSLRRGRRGSL